MIRRAESGLGVPQLCAKNKEGSVPDFLKGERVPAPKRTYRCPGSYVVSHPVTNPQARRRWGDCGTGTA